MSDVVLHGVVWIGSWIAAEGDGEVIVLGCIDDRASFVGFEYVALALYFWLWIERDVDDGDA